MSDRTHIPELQLSRRDFLAFAAVLGTAGLAGCRSRDPVTGKKTFVGLSRGQEIAIDREHSPHQFSSDFGVTQDDSLNNYVAALGNDMAKRSHRPDMPYSFQVVNANYVNAYAFPGGTIAVTRGILVELDNEAELAALLGHEIGHVNARHAAERQSRSMFGQAMLVGATILAGSYGGQGAAEATQMLGSIGSGALLSHYSRDDEREADRLGMDYMVLTEHNPSGMTGLMETLLEQQKHKPNALETMFSTHPLSSERLTTARDRAAEYGEVKHYGVGRERFMDNTAGIRRMKPVINRLQKAETLINGDKYAEAEVELKAALAKAPDDYAANAMMARCQLGLDRPEAAERYAEKAKRIYPREAQAREIAGLAKIARKQYGSAYADFTTYDQLLPGNANVTFLRGLSLDGMGKRQMAAEQYRVYLGSVKQGSMAQHAFKRLKGWGYVR